MALLSINEVTTFRWSFEEDVARYAAAGIPAIGVWRQKVSDFGADKAADLLAEKGLKVSNLLWAGGFTGSDGRTYRESVDDGLEVVSLAGRLNAPCVVVYSGSRAGHTHNHARRLFKDALKELSASAAEVNVNLAIEPMHPGCAAEWTFLNGLDDTLEVLDAADDPGRLKLVFDTYHLGFDSGNVGRIAEIANRIAVVQLGDGKEVPDGDQNRCRLGDGVVPLADFVAALKSAGYDGFYDVELIGEELDAIEYDQVLEHAKEAYARLVAS